jgi:hypothetical protein
LIQGSLSERKPSRAAVWLPGAALVALVLVPVDRLVSAARKDLLAYDFRQTFEPAAEALLDGRSPYPEYGYPPLVAFLSVPFALLPSSEVVVTAVMIACVPAALWLLGVRDWRCYVVALLWGPVFNAVQTANVTLPILLGAAACWRWRERTRVTAVVGGLTAALKILAWPLLVWLAATGRRLAAIGLTAVAVGTTLGLWAVLGFSGLLSYPDSVDSLQGTQGERGYTFQALAADAGWTEEVGTLLAAVAALAALAGCIVYGRRGDDARSFALALVAAIVASPIVWLHSFTLLLAPVAVLRPRLSWVWFVPATFWFYSEGTGNGAPWQTAATMLAAGIVVASVLYNGRSLGAHGRTRGAVASGEAA